MKHLILYSLLSHSFIYCPVLLGGGGGRRLPWAVLGGGGPDPLESQPVPLLALRESDCQHTMLGNRGKRQGLCEEGR